MDWVTTSTILERLRDFDDAAMWQRFASRFRRPMVAFVQRLGLPPADAEDVAQESLLAFMEAYRAGKYKREAGRLRSWLFGIVYHQAANARRRRGAVKEMPAGKTPTAFWSGLPAEAEASGIWDLEWERAMLEGCLEQVKSEVSPKTYRVFEMLVREGRTADDAAAETGMTRNAVYVAKHRVLNRLSELTRECGEAGLP